MVRPSLTLLAVAVLLALGLAWITLTWGGSGAPLTAAPNQNAELMELTRGRLHVGASTTPGHYILPRLIGAFRREYPRVEVAVEIAASQEVIRRVQGGVIDLGVVGAEGRVRSLSFSRFAEDELVLIVPPGHPLAGAEAVTPQDLKNQPLIWREADSGTRLVLEERLETAGFEVKPEQVVMELGSNEAIIAAVEAGLGISLVSRWAVEKSVKLSRLVIVPIKGLDLKRDLSLVRRRQPLNPAAEAFVGFLYQHPPRPPGD